MFECHKNLQIFVKFINFYRYFIKKFNCIIANLSDFLKNSKEDKFIFRFVYISKIETTFEKFKRLFIKISLL